MITETSMQRSLTEFLSPFGRGYQELVREVDRSFGTPRLVVAAGSVLQGFGNTSSDVDLHAVVDDDRVTDFHLSFHDLGFAVDVNYVEESWITEAAELAGDLGRPWPRTRAEWKEEQRRITQLCRFALGLPLAGEQDWLDWRTRAAEAFGRYAAWWWRAEVVRLRAGAELLAGTRPLAAAQRCCDAGLAALNAIATDAGESYAGIKWLGLKLRRLGRDDLLATYDRLLDLPVLAGDCARYLDRCRATIAELTEGWGLPGDPVLAVTPAPGVEVWRVRDRNLVQRWGLRGLEVTRDRAAAPVEQDLTWSGRLSELPDSTRDLAAAGFAWLAVTEEA